MPVSALPAAFTLADARDFGMSRNQVHDLVSAGVVVRLGRSVFVRPDRIDPTLVPLAAATALKQTATLCLTSALVHHELSDDIPIHTDIALPRGVRQPAGLEHVVWHSFAPDTFEIGRIPLASRNGIKLATYSAERTIVDSFRLMHQEGNEIAYLALRRWLARPGNSPSALLRVARSFPKAVPRLRLAMEALL